MNLNEALWMKRLGMLFLPLKKPTYRIRNWSKYNASLKQRGRLTIRVSPEAVKNWTTD